MGKYLDRQKACYQLDVCENSRHSSDSRGYLMRCEVKGKDREDDIRKDLSFNKNRIISVTRIRKFYRGENLYTYEVVYKHLTHCS